MRFRFPLYGRILLWLALNLLLLAGVFVLVIRVEFRLDSLMAGTAGERVQQVADVIAGELRTRPRTDWDQTLARFAEAYGVSFLLVNDRGERLAGPVMNIPEPVLAGLRPPRGGRRIGGLPGG